MSLNELPYDVRHRLGSFILSDGRKRTLLSLSMTCKRLRSDYTPQLFRRLEFTWNSGYNLNRWAPDMVSNDPHGIVAIEANQEIRKAVRSFRLLGKSQRMSNYQPIPLGAIELVSKLPNLESLIVEAREEDRIPFITTLSANKTTPSTVVFPKSLSHVRIPTDDWTSVLSGYSEIKSLYVALGRLALLNPVSQMAAYTPNLTTLYLAVRPTQALILDVAANFPNLTEIGITAGVLGSNLEDTLLFYRAFRHLTCLALSDTQDWRLGILWWIDNDKKAHQDLEKVTLRQDLVRHVLTIVERALVEPKDSTLRSLKLMKDDQYLLYELDDERHLHETGRFDALGKLPDQQVY